MSVTIKLNLCEQRDDGYWYDIEHPILNILRQEARVEGYTRTEGIKEFCKIRYDAALRSGEYGFTSIKFKNNEKYLELLNRYSLVIEDTGTEIHNATTSKKYKKELDNLRLLLDNEQIT